jgi:hypothetical protein
MKKNDTKDTIFLTAMVALFVFASIVASFIAPISIIYFFFWLITSALAYLYSKDRLNKIELGSFLIISFGYVLVVSVLKILFYNDAIDKGYIWFNMIEHLLFSFGFGILLYPFAKTEIQKLDFFITKIILVVGIVSIFGIGNEIFEAIIRELSDLSKEKYYIDTIYDLGMNLIGSSVAGIIILILSRIGMSKTVLQSEEESKEADPTTL